MLRLLFSLSLPLCCLFSLVRCLYGQDFPELYNSDADKDAKPMAAAEAARGFELPAGFQVDVFASEPDVQNPIAMTWDGRGRMWVAENFTYAERSQRFDLSLQDRLLIFEDTDGDGVRDKRTVFTDQIQMLTSVEVGTGGVWLMCPPQLLFIPDRDQDDRPDGPAVVVLDGFEVAQQNYHNYANGLKWGPDGWLYGRCGGSCPGRVGTPGTPESERTPLEGGIWRYHPKTKHFEVLCHGTTNPWGHDWNEMGEGFFINTVNGHLWHLIAGSHLKRPFSLDPNPHVYELIEMHADHWHFDTKGEWMKSRDGAANSFGGGHAHSGVSIYLGDNWPDSYRGKLLTLNFHGRRINQELLERSGSGYVAKHGADLLISADPFFRGIDLSYGPDGAVYVIDWSDTGECHEHNGVHRTSGRVFRVSYQGNGASTASGPAKDLTQLTDKQLVERMRDKNQWYVRMARRLLIDRAGSSPQDVGTSKEARKELHQIASGSDARLAYQAMVTLYGMGAYQQEDLVAFLDHTNEHLRVWAIRLLTDHWPIDSIMGPMSLAPAREQKVETEYASLKPKFESLAKNDPSGIVRLALASTLQRLPVGHRCSLAGELMSRGNDADDHNLPLLVWYGLAPLAKTDPEALAQTAIVSRWPITQRLIARRLAEEIDRHPQTVHRLIQSATDSDSSSRKNLLKGISQGVQGWSRAPKPQNWDRLVAVSKQESDPETMAMVRDLSVLFGDGRALDEVRKLVLDEETEISVRRSALQTFVESDAPEVVQACLELLKDSRLNAIALQGVARSEDPESASQLIQHYYRFRAPVRPQVISVLVSRRSFAKELLDVIAGGHLPVAVLSAFDVRQIRSLGDPQLDQRVTELWGEVRETPEEKLKKIHRLKSLLSPKTLQAAAPSTGRVLFNKTCAQCHRLFGDGEQIGPDLTGANRSNMDYLLENIVDPSAVVGKDFTMTVLLMDDGRVLNGLVVSQNKKTLQLQTQTELKTVQLDEIEEIKRTSESPMPSGLLDSLTDEQIGNLFSYLMQPTQVALPE